MYRLGYAFTDEVSKNAVYYFVDKFDRLWMAEHSWSIHRVKTNVPKAMQEAIADSLRKEGKI